MRPGPFPQGVTVDNYLHKTNARNPNVMDVLREIGLAEKAGSGFDKIFTDLLSKGKRLPEPEETENAVVSRVRAEVFSESLIELSLMYESQTGKPMKLDELLIMNQIVTNKKVSVSQLEAMPYIGTYKLKQILDRLQQLEFIEPTGKTSGQQYILHISKRKTTGEKIEYVLSKKQEKARQKEAILRYVDEVGSINNAEARQLLKLQEKDRSLVSRLLTSLVESGELVILQHANSNKRTYGRKP